MKVYEMVSIGIRGATLGSDSTVSVKSTSEEILEVVTEVVKEGCSSCVIEPGVTDSIRIKTKRDENATRLLGWQLFKMLCHRGWFPVEWSGSSYLLRQEREDEGRES